MWGGTWQVVAGMIALILLSLCLSIDAPVYRPPLAPSAVRAPYRHSDAVAIREGGIWGMGRQGTRRVPGGNYKMQYVCHDQ